MRQQFAFLGSALLMTALLMLACSGEKASPEEMMTLNTKANMAYDTGNYTDAAALFAESIRLGNPSPNTAYSAASAYVLAGDRANSLKYLQAALSKGFHRLDWIESDEDFQTLRELPEWNGFLSRVRENDKEYRQRVNEEIYDIMIADQADRMLDWNEFTQEDWKGLVHRDSTRFNRVVDAYKAGELIVADDFYHAALVLQHGHDSTAYKLSNELCKQATDLNPYQFDARWLYAASLDRYLQSVGKPQVYGTQWNRVDEKWTLEPYDTTAKNDAERLSMGVQPLKMQLEAVENVSDGSW